MKNEKKALEDNGTLKLTMLSLNKHAIDSKWVYKVKFKPDDEVEHLKARLVAHGFTQIEGEDFCTRSKVCNLKDHACNRCYEREGDPST